MLDFKEKKNYKMKMTIKLGLEEISKLLAYQS